MSLVVRNDDHVKFSFRVQGHQSTKHSGQSILSNMTGMKRRFFMSSGAPGIASGSSATAVYPTV
jgi:hypothetical protein